MRHVGACRNEVNIDSEKMSSQILPSSKTVFESNSNQILNYKINLPDTATAKRLRLTIHRLMILRKMSSLNSRVCPMTTKSLHK